MPHLAGIGEVGRLHDVGKVAVPVALLNRCERLTSNDFVIMRDHAASAGGSWAGMSALRTLQGSYAHTTSVSTARAIPNGLRGRHSAREPVVAVADTFDALTAGRPYREPIRCPGR